MLSITKSAFLIDEKYFNRNKRENKQTGYSKKDRTGFTTSGSSCDNKGDVCISTKTDERKQNTAGG